MAIDPENIVARMKRSGIRECPSEYRRKPRYSAKQRTPDSIAFHPGYAGYGVNDTTTPTCIT